MVTNRISATSWSYLKSNFPSEVEKMSMIEVPINRFNLAIRQYRRKTKTSSTRKRKTNIQKYGNELGNIVDWLEENCSGQFYPTFKHKSRGQRHTPETIVQVYFMEESDAMAFKLFYK